MAGGDHEFGPRLRHYRVRAGLTQEALAERAGLAVTAIAALERGRRRRPYPHTLHRLADALALSAAERDAFVVLQERAHDESPGAPKALSPDTHRPTLPAAPTGLIGRERELTAIALILADGARLLTLTGAGGAGKTRLALAAAAHVQTGYPDGAVFVDLSPLSDPRQVAPAIAQALAVRERLGRSLADALTDHLRDRRLLLVLDNFEQVIEAASWLHELLATCPGLTLLVTSRELLRLSDERQYAVQPLLLPDPEQVSDLALLASAPAVALFVQRARAVQAGFALTDANAEAVAGICLRLDGLPLALELAAARIRILSPRMLLARLDHRFPLLTGGAPDLPARQQTLQATIAWSYNLLTTAEQSLFRCVAVFAGGCTLAAAEAVWDISGDRSLDVLDILTSLVDKSLLRPYEDANGEPRFAMLETIREYALDRLVADGEESAVRRGHAGYFVALAESMDLHGPSRGELTRLLEADHANLHAAMTFCQSAPEEGGRLLRFAAALGYYWFLRGHTGEGRAWCEAALARPAAAEHPELRARAQFNAGQLAWDEDDLQSARALLEESAAGAGQVGDGRVHARALYVLGEVLWQLGDLDGAQRVTEESAASARAAGHAWELGLALQYLGMQAFRLDDLTGARARFEQSLTVLGRAEDPSPAAYVLRNLGYVAQAERRFQEALRHMAESLEINREIDDPRGVAACMAALAGLAVEQGLPALSATLSGAMTVILDQAGVTALHPRDRFFHERTIASASDALGADTYAATCAEGRALSFDTVIDMALRTLDQSTRAVASATFDDVQHHNRR